MLMPSNEHEACKKAEDGICRVVTPPDGYPARCVGPWTDQKEYYFRNYLGILHQSKVQQKFPHRTYLDLFAGPGRSVDRSTNAVRDGSPLIVLSHNCEFTQYVFVEVNKPTADALRARCHEHSRNAKVHIEHADCNAAKAKIIQTVKPRGLNLAFIDPTAPDIHFDTIRALAHAAKRLDLIINFPLAPIKRFMDNYLRSEKLDLFFGTSAWRGFYKANKHREEKLLDFYEDQLRTIGYIGIGNRVVVRNTENNFPLYVLIFASKSPLGADFWRKIGEIDPFGQKGLLEL